MQPLYNKPNPGYRAIGRFMAIIAVFGAVLVAANILVGA